MNQNNSSITLTSSASERIMSVLSKDDASQFRVYVTGGGCSGFQYGFKFDDDEAFDDDVIDFGSFKVLIDSMSYPYLFPLLQETHPTLELFPNLVEKSPECSVGILYLHPQSDDNLIHKQKRIDPQ